MVVTFLSANGYSDPSKNNGDCILVDNGSELVIYDCGCEEHARRVVEYMDTHAYSKAKLVLSHNDADHFDGIPYLIEQDMQSNNRIKKISVRGTNAAGQFEIDTDLMKMKHYLSVNAESVTNEVNSEDFFTKAQGFIDETRNKK